MRLSVIQQVHRKEMTLFFAAPIGYLFLAGFLAFTLFVFFWVETFFVRNISDVGPLFEWLPIALIFLSAALTMRMWSEERRSGTLEFVATMPVSTWEFVLGKFMACWSLLFIALVLTLGLPITVSIIGDLDWGPVLAGYLAAMLMGGAYICIGLFVSSRTDSQIVSLLLTTVVCGLFYLIGSDTITQLFSNSIAQKLYALGSGSRFESIIRGVIDLRDLYFYVSVAAMFLVANVFALERERWAKLGDQRRHRSWRLGSSLLVLNLLAVNFWLQPVSGLRLDVTEGGIYSISQATRSYLAQLQEPLLIRGYFSAKTHPDLAPLVPRLQNLLQEYEEAGLGQVRVEIVDPALNPELENEANTKYGIRATPFQVEDRYQASLVNSYFDVLIQYGDEYEVLSFRDLIEVKANGESDFEVRLTNPEFDITRSIKKVLYGFQGGMSIFDSIAEPVEFIGYISADALLPEPLLEMNTILADVLAELTNDSDEKFTSIIIDPTAGDGLVAAEIAAELGIQPMALSLFDESGFYYSLTLRQGDAIVLVDVPESFSREAIRRNVEDSLKRFANGLLKRVVLVVPEPTPAYMQQQGAPPANEFNQLHSFLSGDFEVVTDDLTTGTVPSGADMLMVMDPSAFTDLQVFAMDQFLMKGGTVVVGSGTYAAQVSQAGLVAAPRSSGISTWLAHQGIVMGSSLVMDPQNSAFPVPVPREAGGFTFQELMMLDYPYFVDVRGVGLQTELPITAGLAQVTMSWSSPLTVEERTDVSVQTILSSSARSWLSDDTNIMPKFDEQGLSAFVPTGDVATHTLGVALQGRFTSLYADRDSPLRQQSEIVDESRELEVGENASSADDQEPSVPNSAASVIEHSPKISRLFVFSSNDFAADQTLRMVGAADGVINGNAVQMLTNIVDWTLEDQSLVSIRNRGNFNRTLPGMDSAAQSIIEFINYGVGVIGVFLVMLIYRFRASRRANAQKQWLQAELGGQL